MQAVSVYPEQVCAHEHTTMGFYKEGKYLHQVTYIVEWCVDCDKVLDRRRLSRDRGRAE